MWVEWADEDLLLLDVSGAVVVVVVVSAGRVGERINRNLGRE